MFLTYKITYLLKNAFFCFVSAFKVEKRTSCKSRRNTARITFVPVFNVVQICGYFFSDSFSFVLKNLFCLPSSLSSGEYPHFSNANLSSVSKRFNSSIKFCSLMLYSACCKSLKGPFGTRRAGSPKSLQTLHHIQIPERP